MQTRVAIGRLALVVALGVAGAGCSKYNELKARRALINANELYQKQEYRKAVASYEEALGLDPNLTVAYFYLGNSYDNLYKPGRQGEPENDQYIQKAIENYKLSAEREVRPEIRKLALEYLINAYGPEKLNDPSQSEPIVQRMIQMDPNEPTAYFILAKIYEDSGDYEKAEGVLNKVKDIRPKDAQVYMQLASFYNRQGEFEKTIIALEQRAAVEPNNPEAFYTISTYYWDKAFRDFRLKDPQKKDYILKGIDASDKALQIKPDYMEALTYKNLLLRLQANLEKDRDKQTALIKQADELRNRAIELQKKKTAGVG